MKKILFALLLGSAQAQAVDCPALALQAQSSQDPNILKALSAEALACPADLLQALRRKTGQVLWNAALQQDPPNEAALREVLHYTNLWQARELLADAALSKKDYPAAWKEAQSALDGLSEDLNNPEREAVALRLVGLIDRAASLSESYVANTRGLRGEPMGVIGALTRGQIVKKAALPVQFEFGKTTFTAKGQAAVQDWAGQLKGLSGLRLRLVGHTDAVGSGSANQKLSLARAEAVKAFFLKEGVTLTLTTEGKGETDPPQIEDRASLDAATWEALCRRVVMVRE
jgi:outer membrane protein OmpA-like peptidoglycan-associated protein